MRYKDIPVLKVMFTFCRCIADVKDFDMLVTAVVKVKEYQLIFATTKFKPINIPGVSRGNLKIDTFNYYIRVLIDQVDNRLLLN